ncbi:GerMN domain-containing protein [Bacillus sp. H-16]|uniref:GerMN domain-containing protein n=1 Tax=Alteribacter salitolerans TaxID=2912333 RepID=UPI001962450F|nr:GerMN domain-containing protein [Alteribacter salitolerans]MBM7096542.1 GerMN domain-containing protein [Alteribacter salitolerans]
MLRLIKKPWWMLILAAAVVTACGAEDEAQETFEEVDPPQYVDDEDELGLEGMLEALEENTVEVNEEMDMEEGMEEDEYDEKGGMMEDDDMHEDGMHEEDEEMEEKGGGMMEETAMRELYLMDRNGMVTPQTFALPDSNQDLEQSLSYLVKDGPVTELLPNGFQAVLPAGTEVLEAEVTGDGTAVIDFSPDFTDYRPEDELRILQAVTWTVTQFENVDRVQIKIAGEEQQVMPQNGTPIAEGYSRIHGINLETGAVSDLSNTKAVTVYFLSQHEDQTYYVPVTRRVPANADTYTAVVDELLKGPDMLTSLLTDFRNEVALVEEPKFRNGTVTLNFNEGVLTQLEGTAVSEHVVNMLVLSLTEQEEVEQVSIEVNDNDELMVSSGAALTEPVTRPGTVNTGKY